MNWLLHLWRDLNGTTFALVSAENARLSETNLALEEENALLRKEHRALTNTILGQAGVAPLPPAEEMKPVARMRRLTTSQQRRLELVKVTRTALQEAQEWRERMEKNLHLGKQVSNG